MIIVMYDLVWQHSIAQYTVNVNHLYVQHLYAIRYMDL